MLASILIIIFSVALLVYWLRYSCLLLLQQSATDAPYPLFNFPLVRAEIGAGGDAPDVQKLLDRDYAVLAYLLKTAPVSVEARLLVWDYRLLRVWHTVIQAAFPVQGRKALAEMADVLAALATNLSGTAAAQLR